MLIMACQSQTQKTAQPQAPSYWEAFEQSTASRNQDVWETSARVWTEPKAVSDAFVKITDENEKLSKKGFCNSIQEVGLTWDMDRCMRYFKAMRRLREKDDYTKFLRTIEAPNLQWTDSEFCQFVKDLLAGKSGGVGEEVYVVKKQSLDLEGILEILGDSSIKWKQVINALDEAEKLLIGDNDLHQLMPRLLKPFGTLLGAGQSSIVLKVLDVIKNVSIYHGAQFTAYAGRLIQGMWLPLNHHTKIIKSRAVESALAMISAVWDNDQLGVLRVISCGTKHKQVACRAAAVKMLETYLKKLGTSYENQVMWTYNGCSRRQIHSEVSWNLICQCMNESLNDAKGEVRTTVITALKNIKTELPGQFEFMFSRFDSQAVKLWLKKTAPKRKRKRIRRPFRVPVVPVPALTLRRSSSAICG